MDGQKTKLDWFGDVGSQDEGLVAQDVQICWKGIQNRRLGCVSKPGNLNGSCVRDPFAGLWTSISAPASGSAACPLVLVFNFVAK